MSLYSDLGFENHPFLKTNADEEPNLSTYFVPPPYFDAIIGDPNIPNASVVLAPRGAGKTAQRRMVESHAIDSGFLAVTYDRFEFGAGETVKEVTLQYHLRNIITRILISFLSYASDYPDVIKSLSDQEKRQLNVFIQTYLGEITGDKLQELLKELKGLPEKFKDFWNKNVGFMEPLVNVLLRTYDLGSIDLPNVKHEEKKLTETYKYQLEILHSFVKKLSFNSIYILVDRPDETEQTGNDPKATYQLVRPLLKDLELLGLDGYAFKFFLWDKIEPFYREDARPDRIPQYELKWKKENLKIVLSLRLKAFSNSTISSFKDLMTVDPGYDVDDIICLMSNGSPRNMIRICEKIFAVQAENDSAAKGITPASLDQGVLAFAEMLVREAYGEASLKDIQRVGRELFTTNYVANDIFKVSLNGARNKINGWANVGLISQVGTVTVLSSNKPLNFYCVVDPVAVRLIHRSTPFEKFIKDRWLPCEHCGTDNLIDISLYPVDNEPVCRGCSRAVI